MQERWRLRVFGKVQGVFFRKYAQMTAQSLGLAGFARNEPDLSVTIEVEGPIEKLELFLKWSYKGSPNAQVMRVEVEKGLPPTGRPSFEIM
ncbi:MAG: acylphosphatase [Bacteroidia bacterium]|nr:acylphosphatase [Bacteroidia bacterium]MDW8133566.1 acylphosphatase [Bacteroidia bacterium]